MSAELISNIYLNYGIFGLIVIAFFCLLIWVVKTSEKREERQYIVIDTLSREIPVIRMAMEKQGEAIERIESKIR